MLRKAIGLAVVLVAAGMISGCNQNQQQKTTQQELARGGGHGLRKACADDIQKYCANEQRKKRCLRDNIDKLSDSCKTFLNEHGGHRRNENNDDNKNDDND